MRGFYRDLSAAHFWGHTCPLTEFWTLPREERIVMIAYHQASQWLSALASWQQAEEAKAKAKR